MVNKTKEKTFHSFFNYYFQTDIVNVGFTYASRQFGGAKSIAVGKDKIDKIQRNIH
jgi:hypothetical protein